MPNETPVYSVAKVTTFKTPDGPGFNLTLLRDGIVVAECHGANSGAPTQFSWLERGERELLNSFVHGKSITFEVEPGRPLTVPLTSEGFVAKLLDDHEQAKYIKRLKARCKTCTVAHIKGQSETAFSIWHTPFTPAIKAAIMKQAPDIDYFLNERIT